MFVEGSKGVAAGVFGGACQVCGCGLVLVYGLFEGDDGPRGFFVVACCPAHEHERMREAAAFLHADSGEGGGVL